MITKQNLNRGRRRNRKWRPIPRSKMDRIGIPTGLLDKFGNEIMSGAKIHIDNHYYEGIVLWNRNYGCFGLHYGLWYGEKDPYDSDSYGKFIPIPKDNGMRMDIEIIHNP